jgi:hypothetical protein
MFLIKRGDVGPRVIMLQGVLRRSGASTVRIDGEFGVQTEHAVQAVQRRADVRLTADGQVGIDTWRALERITGCRVINVVDAEDPAQRTRITNGLARAGATDVILMWGQSNAVAAAIGQVLGRAGSSGNIAMVRFFSHGGQGAQNVASGHDASNMDHLAGFTTQNWSRVRGSFAQLARVLAPFGCIDLMGCSVAGGESGRQLLTNMADAIQRPVEGGLHTQYSNDIGYQPFNFEGPVRHVYPGGSTRGAWAQRVHRSS